MLRRFQKLAISILFFTVSVFSCNASAYSEMYKSILTFGNLGYSDEELQNPYGLDVDEASGDIYIADTGNSKIKKFNQFGEYINSFGSEGTADGEFLFPQGVALDGSYIYVVDTASHRIQKFQIDGSSYSFSLKFGSEGSGNDQFLLPRDIEVDSSGNVYVCDSGNSRISRFDSLGNWLNTIGESDSLMSPYGLELDDSGNIYVADTYNHRVVKYAPDGTLLMQFGTLGTGNSEFTYPRDVAVDAAGNIYVADTENYRIQKFDSSGNYIYSIGAFIEFLSPQKIVVDSNYKLYVIDSNTNRLQVYDVTSYITNVYVDPNSFSPDGDGFVDTTSIHYTIPEPAKITIKIYDQDNNLIKDLLTEDQRITDQNQEVWDGKNNSGITVNAGDYIYKIDAVNALNYYAPQQTGTVSVIFPTGQISGTVTDGTNPLNGATVSDGIRSYPTNSSGNYTIFNVPAGTYTVSASKSGCNGSSQQISITEGETVTGVDFVLDCTVDPGTSQITGTVTDGTNPFEGVTVSIGSNNDTTDSSGNYTINNLNAGTYTVTARKYSCNDVSQVVPVGINEMVTGINFSMNCSTEPDIWVSPESMTFKMEEGGGQASSSDLQQITADEKIILDDQGVDELPEKNYEIRLKSRKFTPVRKDLKSQNAVSSMAQQSTVENVHLLIQLEKIPSLSEREALKQTGIKLLSYIPNYAWIATVSAAKASVLHDVPLVRWSGVLLYQDKISLRIQNSGVGKWAWTTEGTVQINVQFFKDVTMDEATQLIIMKGGTIVKKYNHSNAFTISIPENMINVLAKDDIVQWIEDVSPPPAKLNDGAREATGVNIVQAVPYDLDGSGVTVGIWDAGHVDASHDDFATRLIYGDSGPVDDHATHVGGTLGGDGALSLLRGGSANQWKGMAPGVQIISYEWTDSVIEHTTAINNYDIDISQNSWGYRIDEFLYDNCYLYGDYTLDVSEYDSIVRGNFVKPINIVFAAGNERNDGDCGIPVNGGYKNIAPPATGKNIITVGAVNSDDDSMTSFSSWGPVDDGRIKPDVVAPGCEAGGEGYIHSTLPGDTYGEPGKCGTSMAAPVVSGTVALLIEPFRSFYGAEPMPSTIKGLLIHLAQDLENPGPDFKTGFGRIDALGAVDIIIDRALIEGTIIEQNQEDEYKINVADGDTELKVTLVWDDKPGVPLSAAVLVNNLDLILIDPFNNLYEPWTLNPNDPSAPAVTGVDNINNVEQVYIPNPTTGTWTIRVTGTTVPELNQNYSLVSYHLGSTAGEYSNEKILVIHNEGVGNLIVNDIYNSESWLSVDQSSVDISEGNSATLKVTVNGAELTSGIYQDQIEISSNDPDEALLVVPVTFTVIQTDTDGDNIPDGDGANPCTGGNTENCDDNCVDTPNPDQADMDNDGVGDACDNCECVANELQIDTDDDDYGNRCDADLNNDGVVNAPDFGMFAYSYGLCEGDNNYNPDANLTADNGDQCVNAPDFGVFAYYYSKPVGYCEED